MRNYMSSFRTFQVPGGYKQVSVFLLYCLLSFPYKCMTAQSFVMAYLTGSSIPALHCSRISLYCYIASLMLWLNLSSVFTVMEWKAILFTLGSIASGVASIYSDSTCATNWAESCTVSFLLWSQLQLFTGWEKSVVRDINCFTSYSRCKR